MKKDKAANRKAENFDDVTFRGVFRSYQQKVLDETEAYLSDGRIHIVAAPGSGKTVLGLELIRRLGKPALVLSPTIVIADQWGERFSELFLPEGRAEADYISENLKQPGLITSITYQALYSAWNRLAAREAGSGGEGTDEAGAEGTAGSDAEGTDEAEAEGAVGSGAEGTDEADAEGTDGSDAESTDETGAEGTADSGGEGTDEADAEGTDEAGNGSELQPCDFRGFDLVALIRKTGIKTVCLDEAHHLKREWQKSLEAFIEAVAGEITIVALTATPPYDSNESEWRRYISLCGEIDTEIFVPELVAKKTLCPHQDYVMFNYPTEKEEGVFFTHRQNIADCVNEVLSSGLFAASAVRCDLVGDFLPPQDQLYSYAKEYISLAVCARDAGLPPSAKLVGKLMLGRPLPRFSLDHLQRAYAFIAETPEVFGEELPEQMGAICRRHRLMPRGKLLLTDTSRTGKALFSSIGKLESISEIAKEEYGQLGERLRLVVLTDNIRKDFLGAVGTDERIDAIGAVPIFETLRRALPPEARIAMLTGALVIWPLDRIGVIEEIAGKHNTGFTYKEIVRKGIPGIDLPALPPAEPPAAHSGDGGTGFPAPDCSDDGAGYPAPNCSDDGTGSPAPPPATTFTATAAPAHYAAVSFGGARRTMIAVLTEAFQTGAVQAIVGTKALLGEGWDSPCINSLVLASFVGSYVLSNQMRGRAIRVDKNDPDKTANIWHLVAVEPDILPGENQARGKGAAFQSLYSHGKDGDDYIVSEDFEVLKRRFKTFFGPGYHGGEISNSINRLDVICPPYGEEGVARINKAMIRLAADRGAMARAWAESLGNTPAPRVSDTSFVPKDNLPRPVRQVVVMNSIGNAVGIAGVAACLYQAAAGVFTAAYGAAPMLLLTAAAVGFLAWFGSRGLRMVREALSPAYVMRILARGLFEAMRKHGFIKSSKANVGVMHTRGGAEIACCLENASAREQKLFGDAVAEMFSPIGEPRYVIARQGWGSSRYDPRWSFAVPSLFTKIAPAHELAGYIGKRFGRCAAVYTRTESGYRLLSECRVKSFVGLFAASPERRLMLCNK